MAMRRGRTLASCFFICGVMLGARLLASCSNCSLVMTVLQSAGEVLAGVFAEAGLAAAPLAAAGLGCAAHTPSMVRTGALAGTDAEVSGRAAGAGGGTACPHAIVASKAHSSQLLPITHFLQDWFVERRSRQTGNRSTIRRLCL